MYFDVDCTKGEHRPHQGTIRVSDVRDNRMRIHSSSIAIIWMMRCRQLGMELGRNSLAAQEVVFRFLAHYRLD